MTSKVLAVVILGIIGAVGIFRVFLPFSASWRIRVKQGEIVRTVVIRVIDGDTFKTEQGKSVRIIGVDAPEGGECFAEEAKTALTELILGKEVYLESDVNEMDRFGRQLRYIFMNRGNQEEIFIDEWLLEKGLARYFVDTMNVKYQKRL